MAPANQEVAKYFIDKYYLTDEISEDAEFISSYWKLCLEQFQISLDADGNLNSLTAAGFGAGQWSSRLTKTIRWFFDQLCICSHLVHLSERQRILRLSSSGINICRAMGTNFTFDIFRQVCSFEFIKRYLEKTPVGDRFWVLMIGDGYGFLSALIKAIFPKASIVLVDLGKTLLFQSYYCQKVYPGCTHLLPHMVFEKERVDFVYCPTERLNELERYRFDLAVNIASMQEMNLLTIQRYFDFLRRTLQKKNLFYCCNRESKTLPGGELVVFNKYPWHENDEYLVDEYCPWHDYFFSPARTRLGLRIKGVRVPFVNYYDGKHIHRMARLETLE